MIGRNGLNGFMQRLHLVEIKFGCRCRRVLSLVSDLNVDKWDTY